MYMLGIFTIPVFPQTDFKIHLFNFRSTGTPSPMSPSSSHNGSVASFGSVRSSASSGSYDKLNNGNMVSIPAETFERMQQYFAYTRFWLHGQRLWDEAEPISLKCQGMFCSDISYSVDLCRYTMLIAVWLLARMLAHFVAKPRLQ